MASKKKATKKTDTVSVFEQAIALPTRLATIEDCAAAAEGVLHALCVGDATPEKATAALRLLEFIARARQRA